MHSSQVIGYNKQWESVGGAQANLTLNIYIRLFEVNKPQPTHAEKKKRKQVHTNE